MDARRRANVAAGEKVADAQRQATARANVNVKTQTVNRNPKVVPEKKNEFTAFGKTYKIDDNGGLVK